MRRWRPPFQLIGCVGSAGADLAAAQRKAPNRRQALFRHLEPLPTHCLAAGWAPRPGTSRTRRAHSGVAVFSGLHDQLGIFIRLVRLQILLDGA